MPFPRAVVVLRTSDRFVNVKAEIGLFRERIGATGEKGDVLGTDRREVEAITQWGIGMMGRGGLGGKASFHLCRHDEEGYEGLCSQQPSFWEVTG